MKRMQLLFVLLCLSSALFACDPLKMTCRNSFTSHGSSLYNLHFASYRPAVAFPRIGFHMIPDLQTQSYPGIRFDEQAIFCRMENYCLRSYNVKFSIHAGGYRETR